MKSKLFLPIILTLLGFIQTINVFGTGFLVTNNNDSGSGSIRQAIIDANNNLGADSILFNMPGPSFQIDLLSVLPEITDPLTLDGFTQAGASMTLNPVTLYGVGYLLYGIKFRCSQVFIRNLKFIHFKNLNPITKCGAVFCNVGFTSGIILDSIEVDGNIFTDNERGVGIFMRDSLTNLVISNNVFSGNAESILIYDQLSNAAIASNVRVSNNTSSDSVGLNFVVKRMFYVQIDSNNFSCSNFAVRFICDRLVTASIDDNLFNDYNAGNNGIKIDVIRLKYFYARRNSFYGLTDPILIQTGSAGGIQFEQRVLRIRDNHFYDLTGSAIMLWHSGSGGIQMDICDVEIENNVVHSGAAPSYGVFIWITGTTSTTFNYDSIRIADNVIQLPGATSGIMVWFASADSVTNLEITGNIITGGQIGIQLNSGSSGSQVVVMDGFHISKNSIAQCNNNGIMLFGSGTPGYQAMYSHGIIDSNSITGCGKHGIELLGSCGLGATSFTDISINHNYLHDNSGAGININHYDCIVTGLLFSENSIYNNGALGINVDQFPLVYGNPFVVAPVLDSVSNNSGLITINGSLNAVWPNREFIIEYFSSMVADPSGFGEGDQFLFRDTVISSSNGLIVLAASDSVFSSANCISATATDLVVNCTSEFSNCLCAGLTGFSETTQPAMFLYPNPATNEVTLTVRDPGPVSMLLYDSYGRLVIDESYESMPARISLSGLNGIYFYQILQDNHKSTSGKLVITGQ